MSTNPLKKHSSRPFKIYVKLPSQNKFYKSDDLETSPNGELAVRAMTASDDFLLKNPDALLNGDAIFNLLRSCVPGIKNLDNMLMPDVDALLLGIRYASTGDTMKFNHKCDNCDHESEESISIRQLLDSTTLINDTPSIKFESEYEGNKLEYEIFVRPTTYKVSSNSGLMTYEQIRTQQALQNEKITEEQRREMLNNIFSKMAKYKMEVIAASISQVNYVEGEQKEVVTDYNYIHEFINDLPKDTIDEIDSKIKGLNETGVPKTLKHVCDNCGKEGEMEVDINPTNFFDKSS